MQARTSVTPDASLSAANERVASVLERVAVLLAAQGASPFRCRAWEHAAATVRALDRPVDELAARHELSSLEGIGPHLEAAIEEILRTGRLRYLARLEGEHVDDTPFETLPGVGPTLARRIANALHVHTLEDLELAAVEGRLDTVPGIGPRRVRAIRDSLDAALRAMPRRRPESARVGARPSVEILLSIDEQYRTLAASDRLPRIAPRRMNRGHEAWLPVLHTERDGWHFSAFFSNTARAHALGATRDWVVIYGQKDGIELQNTVVTETHGALAGRRVVRGRELECLALHDASVSVGTSGLDTAANVSSSRSTAK